MTFAIDLGDERPAAFGWRVDRASTIMDAALDAAGPMTGTMPEDAARHQAKIDAALVGLILGELHSAKLLDTVRRHFCGLWPLIAQLADREPDAFDSIIMAYAELSTELPRDRAEAQRRRKASAGQ